MKSLVHRYVTRLPALLVLLAGISLSLGSMVHARMNEYCPVTTTEKADPNIFVDYQGKRIHFCCNKCKRDFLADPEAYLANLQAGESGPTSDSSAHHDEDAEREAAGAAEPKNEHDHDHAASSPDTSYTAAGGLGEEDQGEANAGSGHGPGSESEARHNHATDHGEGTGVIGFLGKFHPVVVHFPIALVFMALIFTLTRLLLGTEIFDQMAAVTIYWAAFFAVVAALLGLARSAGAHFPTILEEYFEWHRFLGLVSTGLTVITALAAYYWRNKAWRRGRAVFIVLLILNVIAIAVTGHLGATLVYGPNYYGL